VGPLVVSADGDDGALSGATLGTSLHGIFDSDSFRTSLLAWVASVRGMSWHSSGIRFEEVRDAQIQRVADSISDAIDDRLLGEILSGSLTSTV